MENESGSGKWKWELAKVVIHQILYQWSSQNWVKLATSTRSSFYHTISTGLHKTVYQRIPFAICYNYTILLAYLTLTAQVSARSCKILRDLAGSCGILQESCRNFVQDSCKIPQDLARFCKILQGFQKKDLFLQDLARAILLEDFTS